MRAVEPTSPAYVDACGRFLFRSTKHPSPEPRLAPLAKATGTLDARAIAAQALARPPTSPTETPYRTVSAEWSSASSAGVRPARPCTVEAAAEALRVAFEAAVDRTLAGTKRVAVMTGGGVDSSSLLALVHRRAERTGGTAFAVALDFEGPGDDRPHLAAMERHLRCEVLRIRPEDAARRIVHFHEGVDAAPFTWATGACEIEMLARARANGADCIVTGIGGDELFDGDPRALADLVLAGHPLAALSAARKMRGFDTPRRPVVAWIGRPLASSLLPRALRRYRYRTTSTQSWTPAWAGPVVHDVVAEQARNQAGRIVAGADPELRFADIVTRPHRLNIAWLRHQLEVASGLDRRDPFLDPELVRALSAIPRAWLMHGARRRGLLREAMRGVLPVSVRERMDKAAFEPALERWIASAGGLASLAPLASGERLADLGIVDARPFGEAARAFLAKPREDDWPTIWPALACEAFLRSRDGARS